MKEPNCTCDICGESFYKKLSQQKKTKKNYCTWECYNKSRCLPERECEWCDNKFQPKNASQKTCSKSCATSLCKTGIKKKGSKPWKNKVEERRHVLKEEFGVDSCMIDGCDYDRVLVIHRLIEGRHGGRYEIGNMFTICPNHHAEIHAELIEVEKINDYTLRKVN
jgi:hypothetical protein